MASGAAEIPTEELKYTAPWAPTAVPSSYIPIGGLHVHPTLANTMEKTVCPGTGLSPQYMFKCLESLTAELLPEIQSCLKFRDELQTKIDSFHVERAKGGGKITAPERKRFLQEIGYLVPDNGPTSVETKKIDPEIAEIPAPQLVVPSDNARYVLNAINARWASLFDALYGFDVIPETEMKKSEKEGKASGYNPVRGEAVIEFANQLLDEICPLASGKWSQVERLWPGIIGSGQQLVLLLESGETTSLKTPSLFVGSVGNLGPPNASAAQTTQKSAPSVSDTGRIFLKHNGLHLILEIDRDDNIGRTSRSGIKDITMESALTTILDMEDSVSAVDAADKSVIYTNICGVLRGTLEAPFVKNGQPQKRRMNQDIWLRDRTGHVMTIPGRAVALVRNVGHHMFTDAVYTASGQPVPEGILDCLVTVAASLNDLRASTRRCNSRVGSIYIVKPKQHGPTEVALTTRLFGLVEDCLGLQRNTIKMGIMDEERRTSVNLRECLRAAAERVFFINTGFLDRTGDEIHTCMLQGPVVRKADNKIQRWIRAYEDSNVDIGIFSGMPGKGQIGKGMWAKPDSMKAMLESKIGELMAGASTAWVPSPTAATLHSIHYHRVDVNARQMQLAMRPPTHVEAILDPPLMSEIPSKEAILHELRENAQSILGYVVRWVDLGVGCSKVPDLANIGLMEDRATLRISSQLLANWLYHGLTSEEELRTIFKEMAQIVDKQNQADQNYRPMSHNFDMNIAFQTALQLVLDGRKAPNGYTEYTLHAARRRVKASNERARL